MINLEKKLKIELDPHFESYEEMEPGSSYGVIKIDDFDEHFYMSSSLWSIEDYQKQWRLAFERLKQGKNACFIVNIQPFTPLIATWILHNYGNKICIQNRYFWGKTCKSIMEAGPLIPETSFDFIPEHAKFCDDGSPISEWIVKLF